MRDSLPIPKMSPYRRYRYRVVPCVWVGTGTKIAKATMAHGKPRFTGGGGGRRGGAANYQSKLLGSCEEVPLELFPLIYPWKRRVPPDVPLSYRLHPTAPVVPGRLRSHHLPAMEVVDRFCQRNRSWIARPSSR